MTNVQWNMLRKYHGVNMFLLEAGCFENQDEIVYVLALEHK